MTIPLLEANSWSFVEVEGFIPPARDGHSAVLWENQMIVFGGFEEENQRFSQETYSFDFTTRKWTELKCEGPKPSHRYDSSICLCLFAIFLETFMLQQYWVTRCLCLEAGATSADSGIPQLTFMTIKCMFWT